MNVKLKRVTMLLVLGLVVALMSTAAAMAAEPKDVPADHWAYQAVKQLIDQGYLQLYQDQTFQGNQPVDRYTLATVVAKILNDIASGGVGTNRNDVKILRELTNELRQELVKVISDSSTYSKKTEEMKRSDLVMREDLIRTNLAVQSINSEQLAMQAEQAELQKEVQQIVNDLTALAQRVTEVEKEITKLKAENKKQKLYLIVAIVLGLAGAAN
ncbi:MAG: S-layer homology domain-containing protein [Bacillota bacterium]|jgi:cell division protein FtsB